MIIQVPQSHSENNNAESHSTESNNQSIEIFPLKTSFMFLKLLVKQNIPMVRTYSWNFVKERLKKKGDPTFEKIAFNILHHFIV